MEKKDILKEWDRVFVKENKFIDPLTEKQREIFLQRKELEEIINFSDNNIKLAIFSSYLNQTAKLKDILNILNELSPNTIKIEVPKKEKKIYESSKEKKIYESSKEKESKKLKTKSRKNKNKLSAKKKFEIRKRNRKILSDKLETEKLKEETKKSKEVQVKIKENFKKLEEEREQNYKKFGEKLSDSEIKGLLKNDPEGYDTDRRFRKGPQDKDFT
tara:strand:+ start:121 stop:768 length:648 start_codon:yes stop_codon:yes gene_type:complete